MTLDRGSTARAGPCELVATRSLEVKIQVCSQLGGSLRRCVLLLSAPSGCWCLSGARHEGKSMADRDGLVSLRNRRFAANQTVFRRSNERLSRQLGAFASGPVQYVCECGDDSCGELISLLPYDYEHVRSNSAWFLIALDHEILSGASERRLETHEHHQVVEKSGAAGAIAEALDTRRGRAAR